MKTRPRYRLYIDESGDHVFRLLDDPAHRYLALLGVWLSQADAYVSFSDELASFKRSIFGPRPDNPIVLHREDIINRRGAFGVLGQEDIRTRFNDGLARVVAMAAFRMVCVVADKQELNTHYASPFHPYDFCMAVMLERYALWLAGVDGVGDVMAEARGRREDEQLRGAYTHVFTNGTQFIKPERFQRVLTSRDIKIRPKTAGIAGLELADVLAHPVKQAILAERDRILPPGEKFGTRLCRLAGPKFNCDSATGDTWGHGKVWLPKGARK